MKKTILSICLIATIVACKKENNNTTPGNSGPATPSNNCTATINGNSFAANSYSTVMPFGFVLNAFNFNAGQPTIIIQGQGQTGTFTIGQFSPNHVSYRINNVTYGGNNGSLVITQIDTTGGSLKSLDATFNVNTDTISGVSFQITNGAIHYVE